MQRKTLVLIILATLAILPLSSTALEDEAAYSSGLAWLKARGAPDGSMGKDADLPASASAIKGLSALGDDITLSLQALPSEPPNSTSSSAWKLLAMKDTASATELLAYKHADGSFGSLRETALAALALAEIDDPNIDDTLGYLSALENTDGSYGTDSDILATSLCALALHAAEQDDSEAMDYILRSMHPGGGFGNTAANAWAILALKAYGGHPVELNAAVNNLLSERNDDGGWGPSGESDVYLTGLCMWALSGSGADLSGAASFLKSRQDLSGLWVSDARAIKVTSTVVDVLRHIDEGAEIVGAGFKPAPTGWCDTCGRQSKSC